VPPDNAHAGLVVNVQLPLGKQHAEPVVCAMALQGKRLNMTSGMLRSMVDSGIIRRSLFLATPPTKAPPDHAFRVLKQESSLSSGR
jgi:hypothetical protein